MTMSRIKQFIIFRWLICIVRIPYGFMILRGHAKRKNGMSIDATGSYRPWMTYPIIDYLDNIDFTGCTIFEYGAGSSSYWWAKKGDSVISVELDIKWHDKLVDSLPDNVTLLNVPDVGQYPLTINNYDSEFDVIVIDGAERYQCAVCAIGKVSSRGIIILDNADWCIKSAELLRNNGFIQIDFYGYSPNNSYPSMTSLFFKSTDLVANRIESTKAVIGGNVEDGDSFYEN